MERFSRPLYAAGGSLSLGLGAVGAFVPGLPTTPFVLLAAFCFARSRPDWHARLRAHPAFGPLVRDWEDRGAVPLRAKAAATALMAVLAGLLWLSPGTAVPLKAAVTAVQAAVVAFLWSRPS